MAPFRRSRRELRPVPCPEVIDPPPFLAWLLERGGLDPANYRAAALQRRLPACLRQLRTQSPEAARRLLEQEPRLLPFALSTVLIGVSHFFRDAAVFENLERKILPALLASRGRLRICSVGCSRGQEPYSIAILLAELGALHRCELIGSDCREEALRAAARGAYSAGDVAALSPSRLARFFTPAGDEWTISNELRDAVSWRKSDLFSDDAPVCDLVLCRNVVIYLRDASAARAWQMLHRRLRPDGILVTGKAEKPPASAPFARVAPATYLRLS